MKLFQKLIFICGLIVASVYFIYTLSFSSGWALGQPLGDFYEEAQSVNKLIYKWALWTLIFAGMNIILHSHKNRNYYILNYIFVSLLTFSLIGSSIATLTNIPPLKKSYLELNETYLKLITAINYSKISTNIFDIGMYISILMIVQASLIIFITVYKFISQIKRAKIKKLKRLEIVHDDI